MNQDVAAEGLQALFGRTGDTHAEMAWFLFGMGQLVVMSQASPGQAQLLAQKMRNDVDDFRERTSALIDQMESILSEFDEAIEDAIENTEEDDSENL